jgi:hypothetical protein
MTAALRSKGELYLLRLHPKSLSYKGRFSGYELPGRPNWQHGDLQEVCLITGEKPVKIYDHFWQPERVAQVFLTLGCECQFVDLAYDSPIEKVRNKLITLLEAYKLDQAMPEWTVPLYQLVRVWKKNA